MVVARLNEPLDTASLRVFRAMFGVLLVIAALRFFTHGWIDADYRQPHHFFHYWGFGWMRPLPYVGMVVAYGAMAVAAAAIALGRWFRPACAAYGLLFTYAHLIDKSNYLNHYYLVGLLVLLMLVVPLDRTGPQRTWMLWVFRFQIAVVYFYGGLGKIGADWLFDGEPLRIWLAANAELPILGRLFHLKSVALAFAWSGMLFDLTIVGFLLWRRTRVVAYVAVVLFHVMTAMLFHIGMFPWIMIASATLFFDPSWPRRILSSFRGDAKEPDGKPLAKPAMAIFAAYAAFQLLFPLRSHLYPGNTLWSEEGFRFAWKVMLIEKSGELEFVVTDDAGHRTTALPRDYLTPFQTRMAATQPDMILELAHIVRDDYAQRWGRPVQVHADAVVSFNGRLRAPLIDPAVDLAAESDRFVPKPWILPAPVTKPIF